MSKPVKNLMATDLKRRFEGIDSACVVSISRLDAIKTNQMRGRLKQLGIRMHVVKNSLARRALAGGPLEPLANSLQGPSAIVFGDPAVTDIAKELQKWAEKHEVIELKDGILEGDPELFTVELMAKMKGQRELVAEIAHLLSSPVRHLAGALQSPAGKIAGCLKALIDKAEPEVGDN